MHVALSSWWIKYPEKRVHGWLYDRRSGCFIMAASGKIRTMLCNTTTEQRDARDGQDDEEKEEDAKRVSRWKKCAEELKDELNVLGAWRM